jgi:hypothetical protein
MMADLPKDPQAMSDADWKQVLNPKEYHVLRQKGTEPAGTGEYDGFYRTLRGLRDVHSIVVVIASILRITDVC